MRDRVVGGIDALQLLDGRFRAFGERTRERRGASRERSGLGKQISVVDTAPRQSDLGGPCTVDHFAEQHHRHHRLMVGDAAETPRVTTAGMDADLLTEATALAARAASFPRALTERTKATIQQLHGIDSSEDAVAHELDPQAWSMDQPPFLALVTKLQQQISRDKQ